MAVTRVPRGGSEYDDFVEDDSVDYFEDDYVDDYVDDEGAWDESAADEYLDDYFEDEVVPDPAPARRRRRRPPGPPRERTLPAGRVLVLMVIALAVAGLINAEAISRSSNAEHADSWRADVADLFATLSPLTWIRSEADQALGHEHSDQSAEDLVAERQAAQAGTSDDSVTEPTTPPTTLPEVRTPTATDPLRLYVGGDSMASEFSKSMERVAASTGVMTSTLDPRVSTGLSRPDYFNWPAHLANDILPLDQPPETLPEVLVLMFGANDAQGMTLEDGSVLERFTEPWLEEYRKRVAATMDLLEGDNRLTFWVGMPIMGPEAGVKGQDELNYIYWSEAETRPWIVYVDSWPFFADPNGNFSHDLPAKDGTVHGMRQGDDVHWSKWGADRIAWEVLEHMAAEIDLSAAVLEYPADEVAPDEIQPRDEVPDPQ